MERQAKIEQVERLKKIMKDLDNCVLVDFRGLKVEEVTDLRRKLRQAKGSYEVVKNRLAKIALESSELRQLAEYFRGPTAMVSSPESPISIIKVMTEFAKEHDCFRFKSGFVEGKVVSIAELEEYAKMPSREFLLAKLIGLLNAPMQKTLFVMQAPMRKLTHALNAVAAAKEASPQS